MNSHYYNNHTTDITTIILYNGGKCFKQSQHLTSSKAIRVIWY